MKVRLTISFDGTSYHGWQIQKNAVTVQETLKNAVRKITGEDALITGCGRTDSGVHAINYVCSFDTSSRIPEERFAAALNANLPGDIVCKSAEFAADYYAGSTGVSKCLREYANAAIPYGKNEDEHAGEQFYTENIRMIANQYICGKSKCSNKLIWLTGDVPLAEQARIFCGMCAGGTEKLKKYYDLCADVSEKMNGGAKMLFDATVFLQAKIHYFCARGAAVFGEGFAEAEKENYLEAFMKLGRAAELFDAAQNAMRSSEYGVWSGFYANDCFADIKHTAYMIRKVMGVVREKGDNARHDKWYREAVYAPEDRCVMTLLVLDNHMTDWELYEAFKEKRDNG